MDNKLSFDSNANHLRSKDKKVKSSCESYTLYNITAKVNCLEFILECTL